MDNDWRLAGRSKNKVVLNMNPCNNKQNRGFSVKGNRHVGWPREWDWQSGWRSQWQMMRLEQSRIACNPCEDGLKYKQKRHTAVIVMKPWWRNNWVSTRRSWLMLSLGQTREQTKRLRLFVKEEEEEEEKKEEEEEVYSCLCHEPVMLKELRFYQKVAAIC